MGRYLEAGKIVSTHAVHGTLKVMPWCDSPRVLCGLKKLYLDEKGSNSLEIEEARPHKNGALIKFRGYDDIETARKLIERVLWLDREDLELEEDTIFVADLIGLSAVDAEDTSKVYGQVVDVTNNGAQDIYHILLENGKTGMIPAAGGMVQGIDLDSGLVRILPVEGLFDNAY